MNIYQLANKYECFGDKLCCMKRQAQKHINPWAFKEEAVAMIEAWEACKTIDNAEELKEQVYHLSRVLYRKYVF